MLHFFLSNMLYICSLAHTGHEKPVSQKNSLSDAPISVKAPEREKLGCLELSGSGRPREPSTALGTAGSPSCSCPRQCAWRRTLGCVRPSSSARAPAHAAPGWRLYCLRG